MTFVGIDLAADVKRTGLAVLREGAGSVVVNHVRVGATDGDLIDAIQVAARAGVDVPFGWPAGFVDTIQAHARGVLEAPTSTGSEWRRNLALRATDQAVHRRTGLTPLSVSTDRIAYPALRWAGIEASLRDMGAEVARDGAGVVCEVYPAAALKLWGLPYRRYKGAKNSPQRAALVDMLSEKFPWLQWNGHRDVSAADDNALDAVIAALVAREVERGRCEPPPTELANITKREGWIWLPGDEPPGPARPTSAVTSPAECCRPARAERPRPASTPRSR